MVLSVSASLSSANFASYDEAIESAAQSTLKDSGLWADSAVSSAIVRRDLLRLLGPGDRKKLLAALSDLKRCLGRAAKEAIKVNKLDESSASALPPWSRASRSSELVVADASQLRRAAKKCDFYLAWVLSHGDEELSAFGQ